MESERGFCFGRVEPMYLTLVNEPFDSPDYIFEVKWDGIRGLGFFDPDNQFRLQSRNGNDISGQFPEIISYFNQCVKKRSFIVDGELCIFNAQGKPSFELVKRRVLSKRKDKINDSVRKKPATYIIWDILKLGKQDLTSLTLTERKKKLEEVLDFISVKGELVIPCPVYNFGRDLFEAVKKEGLEGIVAKRRDSPYLPGKRTLLWQKIKNFRQARVVIGGFFPVKQGSYLVGVYTEEGFFSLGRVGGGLTGEEIKALDTVLWEIRRENSPFINEGTKREKEGVVWVEPYIILRISYLEFTEKQSLRHAVIEGIDLNGNPGQCLIRDLSISELK